MKLTTAPFVISLLLTLLMSTDGKADCRGYIYCYDTSGKQVGYYLDLSTTCSWDFGCTVTSRSSVPAEDCNKNVSACKGNCGEGMAVCHWRM